MEQLLQITTIPIKYELKVHDASLEYHNSTAEVEISRNEGGMQIKSRPIKLHIDTYEARNSVVPTTKTQIARNAEAGKRAAYDATANFGQEGRMMLRTKIGEGGETLKQLFAQRVAAPTGDFQLGFLPTTGPDIEWEGPELSIEYQMDKLNFDTKIQKGEVQFIPGDIELSISQYPDVQIEYIGKPIYVPPSAMERFEPHQVDVEA